MQVEELYETRQPEELSLQDVEKSHIARVLEATKWQSWSTPAKFLAFPARDYDVLSINLAWNPPNGHTNHPDDIEDEDTSADAAKRLERISPATKFNIINYQTVCVFL